MDFQVARWRSLGVGRATISEYFRRAGGDGLSWPLPADLSDADLERRLFSYAPGAMRHAVPQPDWAYVHAELRRKGVTLSLLWEEYRGVHPEGYGYSRYCEFYTRWEGKLSPVMRQRHPAGERLFVDYAGPTVDVVCPKTGEVRTAQIFVTTSHQRRASGTTSHQRRASGTTSHQRRASGTTSRQRRASGTTSRLRRASGTTEASSYTYVEASWTQKLPDWISSHVRAFAFFGGAPAQRVPDNLKAGVTKACFYDPAINRTYGDMAAHYDTAIVPARPRKPKDKAKVEGAVLLAERWILARLRNQRFFGLDEVNAAIRPLLDQLNEKASRHLRASRRDLFERLDRPALKPLPVTPYVYAEWQQCRAGLDYHVGIGRHYYLVPYQLLKKKLWARITVRTVEVCFNGQRVASHARTSGNHQHSAIRDHMPAHHRFRIDWSPERIRGYAAKASGNVKKQVRTSESRCERRNICRRDHAPAPPS
jgi:transposase